MQPMQLVQVMQPLVAKVHKPTSYATPLRTTHNNTWHTSCHHTDHSMDTQPKHAHIAAQGPNQNETQYDTQMKYLTCAPTPCQPTNMSQAELGAGDTE